MINFICEPCKAAGKVKGTGPLALLAKNQKHKECPGGSHCDCQHRVGRKNVL